MSSNLTRRPILLAAAAALGGLTLGACGSSSTTASPSPSATPSTSGADESASLSGVTLRAGATGWNTLGAVLQVAGLDKTPYTVKWSVFTGGDKQMQALQAGALDVAGASQIPPVFAAANTKPKWKAIASEHATTLLQNVVVGKNSKLTSIAQLKGKKVGYVQNTTAQYFLVKLLQQAGLKFTDIQAVPLLPNDGVAALSGGSIDAFASYGNSIITILQNGGRSIGSGENILSGNFVYLASDAVLANPAQSAAAADLLARLSKAYAVMRAGKEQQYAQLTATATHQPVSQALAQLKAGETQRPTSFAPVTPADIASQQEVADVFTALGTIPKVDVSSFWSTALNTQLSKALTTYSTAS